MKLFVAVCLLAVLYGAHADHFAVLVAGSNGFWNYRHQTDICHSYQIMIKNGIPADNIIVLSYDDVANSSDNPVKGKLFNKPTYDKPGTDVYEGCVIDYKGEGVTPENFIAVLTGDAKTAGGKVLKSTSDDKVFVNFADHGGPGLIAFPSEYLYEKDLTAAFQKMYDTNMYSELVFYLEACESGSMFANLPTDINLYATSASSPTESSWGTYCPPDDVVGGISIGSCLGDLYSVNWMEDTDTADARTETLLTQFNNVAKLTDKSKVMQWGQLSIDAEVIGDFEGNLDNYTPTARIPRTKRYIDSSVDSRDIKLHYVLNKYNKNPSLENYLAMKMELNSRDFFDSKFQQMALAFGANEDEIESALSVLPPIRDW